MSNNDVGGVEEALTSVPDVNTGKTPEERRELLESEIRPVFEKYKFTLGAKIVRTDSADTAIPVYVDLIPATPTRPTLPE